MRNIVINNILNMLPERNYNSIRWHSTPGFYEHLLNPDFNVDNPSKEHSKKLNTYAIDEEALNKLSDTQLVKFLIHVTSRLYRSM